MVVDDDFEESTKVHLDKFDRFYIVLEGSLRVRNLYIPEKEDGQDQDVPKDFIQP